MRKFEKNEVITFECELQLLAHQGAEYLFPCFANDMELEDLKSLTGKRLKISIVVKDE